MPLFDKKRSFWDNLSNVIKEHKSLIFLVIILTWMTKNKWIVLIILMVLFSLIGELRTLIFDILNEIWH